MKTDARTVFAMILIVGFIVLIGIGMFHAIPEGNVKTVDGAIAGLSAAVGAAVMALLRTDKVDEQRVDNTSKAFEAITAVAPPNPAPDITLPAGGSTTIAAEDPTS